MMEMATPHVALMRRKKYADLPTGKLFSLYACCVSLWAF